VWCVNAGLMGGPRKMFQPKNRLNVIENTLEKLSQDLKTITHHQSHVKNIKVEVSTSNVESCRDEVPLSVNLALQTTSFEVTKYYGKDPSSSGSTSDPKLNDTHVDKRSKTSLQTATMEMTLNSDKYASTMVYKYLQAHQEKEEPLSAEKICSNGHKLFAKQDWKGAMEAYTRCIPILMKRFESNGDDKSSSKKQQQDLLLAYSNRAETFLRLHNYENAEIDATKV
jgi:hypothetical protein